MIRNKCYNLTSVSDIASMSGNLNFDIIEVDFLANTSTVTPRVININDDAAWNWFVFDTGGYTFHIDKFFELNYDCYRVQLPQQLIDVPNNITIGQFLVDNMSEYVISSNDDYYYDVSYFVKDSGVTIPPSFNKDVLNIFQTASYKPIYTVEIICTPVADTYVFDFGKVYNGGIVVADYSGRQIGNGSVDLFLEFNHPTGRPLLNFYDCFKFQFIGFSNIPNISTNFTKDFYCIGDIYFRNYIDAVLYMKRSGSSNIPDLTAIYTESYVVPTSADITAQIASKDAQIVALNASIDSLKTDIATAVSSGGKSELLQAQFDSLKLEFQTLFTEHNTIVGENMVLKSTNSFLLDVEKQKVTALEAKITLLEQALEAYKLLYPFDRSTLSIPATLSSLNGVGCEHKDGTFVNVSDRAGTYTVVRSYSVLVSDNNYTVVYDLSDEANRTISAPESLVVAVAQTVTAP